MFPEPTIATLALDGMNAPLFESQPHGPESIEFRDKMITGPNVDRAGTRARQHDVTFAQLYTKTFHLAGQPRHRRHRIAQHSVAAAVGHHLAVAGPHRVDAPH